MKTSIQIVAFERIAMATRTQLGSIALACKITELTLICAFLGLHFYAPPIPQNDAVLVQSTLGASIIVVFGLVLGHLIGDRVPRKIDLFYTITGILIFVAVGEIAEREFIFCALDSDIDAVQAIMGTAFWILAVIFFADAVVVYKDVPQEPHGK